MLDLAIDLRSISGLCGGEAWVMSEPPGDGLRTYDGEDMLVDLSSWYTAICLEQFLGFGVEDWHGWEVPIL